MKIVANSNLKHPVYEFSFDKIEKGEAFTLYIKDENGGIQESAIMEMLLCEDEVFADD